MPRFLVTLQEEQFNRLKNISDRTNIPMSVYVRQGIEMMLSSQVPCTLQISGMITSGYVIMIPGK